MRIVTRPSKGRKATKHGPLHRDPEAIPALLLRKPSIVTVVVVAFRPKHVFLRICASIAVLSYHPRYAQLEYRTPFNVPTRLFHHWMSPDFREQEQGCPHDEMKAPWSH